MCPDKQIISAFVDNEINGGHNERLVEHLSECEMCKKAEEKYRRQNDLLLKVPEPDFAAAERRVYNNVLSGVANKEPSLWKSMWRGKITLPVPVAAFTGVLFFLLLGGFLTLTQTNKSSIASIESQVPNKVEINVNSLEELSRYFEADGVSIEINMKLPEDSRFHVVGEPQFLRVADF